MTYGLDCQPIKWENSGSLYKQWLKDGGNFLGKFIKYGGLKPSSTFYSS